MKRSFQIFILLFMSIQMFSQSIEGTFVSKYDRYYKGFYFPDEAITQHSEVAWIGERVYYHVLVKAEQEITSLDYRVSGFKTEQGTFLPGDLKIRFAQVVKGDNKAKSCAEYPYRNVYSEIADALTSDTIKSLAAGEIISLFLVLDIPQESFEGIYDCTFTVATPAEELNFSLIAEVIDSRLPAVKDWSFHLDIWQHPAAILEHYNASNRDNQIELWSEDHFDLIIPAYKILAEAGQKVITTHIKEGALGSPSMVKWIKKADQSWHYDFRAFDRFVELMISTGIDKQISCFSPVGWNESVIRYWDEVEQKYMNLQAPLESAEYATRWDHYLTFFKSHLVEKRWFDRTVLYLDEVSEAKIERVVEVITANDPDWKIGIAYSRSLTESIKASFYDLSGILEDASNQGISEEHVSTFYTSCTQTIPNSYITIENSPAEMTWMSYYAANQEFDGYLRWAYDLWTLRDPFDMRDGSHTAGDFSFVYRSGNINPIVFYPSLRLEMLREGIEDYEKIRILKEKLSYPEDSLDDKLLIALDSVLSLFDMQSAERSKDLVLLAQLCISGIAKGDLSQCVSDDVTSSTDFLSRMPRHGEPIIRPNPNSGIFRISGIQAPIIYIKIVNLCGQTVFIDDSYSLESDSIEVAFNPHVEGLYMVEVATEMDLYYSWVLIK